MATKTSGPMWTLLASWATTFAVGLCVAGALAGHPILFILAVVNLLWLPGNWRTIEEATRQW